VPAANFRFAILFAAFIAISFSAFAQGVYSPMPKPSNLKILPKDISISDLTTLMKKYNGQLGVECSYCHASIGGTKRLDYASDAKKEKATGRLMMTMVNDLNSKYLAKLPTSDDAKVNCGTCHRGHAKPEEFVPLMTPPPVQ
jgi:hypothetical protein